MKLSKNHRVGARRLLASLSCAMVSALIAPLASAAESDLLVLTHVNVIDVTSDVAGAAIRGDMTVVLDRDRIASIGETTELRVPSDARIVDARGKFLIPGLWDMHVHWYDERFLGLFIANGVTGVRQMFGAPVHLEWRRRSEAGELLAPRQFIASPIVDGIDPTWPGSIAVGDEASARAAVRRIKSDGFDFVKVYDGLRKEGYFALVDEAKKQRLTLAGHLPHAIPALAASEAGQRSMEHLGGITLSCSSAESEIRQGWTRVAGLISPDADFDSIAAFGRRLDQRGLDTYDPRKAEVLFELFARNETWQCPTLTVLRAMARLDDETFTNDPRLRYMPPGVRTMWLPENDFRFDSHGTEDFTLSRRQFERALELVRAMNHAHVPILAGTDALNPFCFPGFSLHDELELLVDAGLTPMRALQAATINPATYMGARESLGTIEPGQFADLVLLDANPLDDITNTQRIAAVFTAGRMFDRTALDSLLLHAEQIANLKSIANAMQLTIESDDVTRAIAQYHELKRTQPDAYDFSERELNSLGYRLLEANQIDAAVQIFELNVEEHPTSSNAHDSLGEAYKAAGDTTRAIESYRQSLDLDPTNANARSMLEALTTE